MRFSEVEARKSREYVDLFERGPGGRRAPYGPIAHALLIRTADKKIVGNARGDLTPLYPGGVWAIGGNLDDPKLNLAEFLERKEVSEELQDYATGGFDRKTTVLGI